MVDDRRWRWGEVAGVLTTAAVFVVLPKPPGAVAPMAVFIPACIGTWGVYLAVRVRSHPELADRWGLGPGTSLRPLVARLGPLLAVLVSAGIGVAVATGRPLLPAYLWLSLLLYPLWGLVQQWLVQALVVDNARVLVGLGPVGQMVLGGVGFGAIHFAHPPLVLATGLMGAVYVYLFQRWRNLWPLAVCHGWLGSLFYPWVLDLNPTALLVQQALG